MSIPTAGPLRSSSGSRVGTTARGPDGIISTHVTVLLISLAAAAVSPGLTDPVPVLGSEVALGVACVGALMAAPGFASALMLG